MRGRFVAAGLVAACACFATPVRQSRADDVTYSARDLRAGRDILDRLKIAAVLEGTWSFALELDAGIAARALSPPYPWGLIGNYTTRVLYGTTWTAMLGLETVAVILGSGGTLEWLDALTYRSEWISMLDAPSCPSPGALAGCGIGVAGFGFLRMHPHGSAFWYEAGGGWIEQRIYQDDLRTVAESAAVLTPFTMTHELSTNRAADVSARLRAGAGVFVGTHNAHMHPRIPGSHVYKDRPWTEIYPIETGGGPGAHVEGRVTVLRHLAFDADLTFAPFLAGVLSHSVFHAVAPLDYAREGMSVWRKASAGIGWVDPKAMPFDLTLSFFAAELSERPIDRIGYRGLMLRFDIPLRVSEEN